MTSFEAPHLFSVVPPAPPKDLPEPTGGPYFVYTKDGWYVHRNWHFGRVLHPIKKADGVDDNGLTPYLWTRDNEVPIEIIGQAWSFFRAIYERDKAEAMVDITWSEEKGYRLFVPKQSTSGGGVKAERKMEHLKGQHVGTIHSHCMMNAFHSGTDTHDADEHDGLHITLGKVMNKQPEIAIMMSVSKVRWDFKYEELWEGEIPLITHPEWWEKFVNNKKDEKKSSSLVTYMSKQGGISTYSPRKPSGGSSTYPIITGQGRWDYDTYRSVDELLWREADKVPASSVLQFEAFAGILDDIAQEISKLGYDFDYELTKQVGKGNLAQRLLDDMPFKHWFGED